MTNTFKLRLSAGFLLVFAVSSVAVFYAVMAQATPVQQALQVAEQAYMALKAADEAGANVTSLASQYNSAIELLDNASRLEKAGDMTTASALASQATSQFQTIIQQAQSLREAATAKKEEQTRFQSYVVPAGAVMVAVAAAAALLIYRKVRSRQFDELKIRIKENP